MNPARALFLGSTLGLARAAFAPTSHSFARATRAPAHAQQRLLSDLAARAARTSYGKSYGVRNADDFRARLPIVRYEDLAPFLAEQKAREARALVADPVLFYEKTSGSSGPAKYIPYTSALRRSFTRMFAIWVHDVLRHGPRVRTGSLYFSVSPSFAREPATEHGVPVGLNDDADYLGPLLKRALEHFFVAPPGAIAALDAESWKREVAKALVHRSDLEVISVWNPSMLGVLLDTIESHRTTLRLSLGSDPRARALESPQVEWERLWPSLKLISCWTSASAAPLAQALSRRLPHLTIQGKGLLATEAPVTVPIIRAGGFVPMVDEVFLELEDVTTGEFKLLHEVSFGRTYELIISQKGGLCRYRLGDRVRVGHSYAATPCLELVGRAHNTSDLVGEKLHESFVADALATLHLDFASVWSLLPVREPYDHYVLLVDSPPVDTAAVEDQVDRALCHAHHYAHARALGQLGSVRVCVAPKAAEVLRDHELRRGVKWGDLKHRLLFTEPADSLLREAAVS